MVETKSKVWLRNDKNNFIEATFSDDSIAMDVYLNKKALVKHQCKVLWHILFVRKPVIKDKKELSLSMNELIDQYYEEDISKILKHKILIDLELAPKEIEDISYIG